MSWDKNLPLEPVFALDTLRNRVNTILKSNQNHNNTQEGDYREMHQFKSRSFDDMNLNYSGINYTANNAIFNGKFKDVPSESIPPPEEGIDYNNILKRADSVSAIITCYEKSSSNSYGFINNFCDLLNLDIG